MSIIDDSNKSIKNRPFDENNVKESIKNSEIKIESVSDEKVATYLSTRASIFSACVMASICLLVPYCYSGISDLFKALGFIVGGIIVYVMVWSFTFRFFEKPLLMPLNIMLNVLPVAILAYFIKTVNAFESLTVLAGGVTCLTLMSNDLPSKTKSKNKYSTIDFFEGEFIKSSDFIMADCLSEIIVPLLLGVISATLGVLFTSFAARYGATQNAGIRLMVTSLLVMLLSFIISRVRGRDFYMSSSKISDKYDLPSISLKTLKSFVLRRIRFAISLFIICFVCYICDYIDLVFSLNLPFVKYVVSILLILSFAFIRGKHTRHKAQYTVELCLCYAIGVSRCLSLQSTLISILAGVLVDILITGMFFTYKRTLIHSKRSKYVEGMPLMLLSVSLLLIVCASVLDYWSVML